MTEDQKTELAKRWDDYLRKAEKERLSGSIRIAESYESSAAKVEEQLQREDVDPRDYI